MTERVLTSEHVAEIVRRHLGPAEVHEIGTTMQRYPGRVLAAFVHFVGAGIQRTEAEMAREILRICREASRGGVS